MSTLVAIRSLLFAVFLSALSGASSAQIGVGVSVSFGPPAIPVYEQPICPGEGYIWTPGFWAWDSDGDDYYWVPGTWILAPEPGFLWTPGYWAWGGSAFFFHEGYWGPHIGFYGGINYGFGYFGRGYEGGRWENNRFYYNTSVNRVNTTIIHNTYNTRIENITVNHVSYNGGHGGIEARPSPQEEAYSNERHTGRVPAQNEHIQQARSNPELRASANHGKPSIAATAKPAAFSAGAVAAKEAGAPYKAPERASTGNVNRPPNYNEARGNENRPPTAGEAHSNNHASELQSHQYTAQGTGNAATDQKYQQQEEKLAAKQNQEHQKMQQQQEKEHQQMVKKNASDVQNQQMEQHHAQQTQQLEQNHAAQQQRVQTHQQPPHQNPPPKH
jgi:hypothetical protein